MKNPTGRINKLEPEPRRLTSEEAINLRETFRKAHPDYLRVWRGMDLAAIERRWSVMIVLEALREGILDEASLRALQDALDVSYLTPSELRTLLALRDPDMTVSINPKQVNPHDPQ